ncbi:hypothetical protein SK803_44340 [Lentzea sp. BCCO 10_0856]|uniref:Colicin import membrane protein n=1 Tax=Lentzea miocenica TaxID=3095431 RepID=A0ABU4TGF8_9PSEU|nr:hypothetical protein [Lentzea sp. BCCO 10_0856]MDX8037267.1 hypothetical protein [Lentzea sp. BCCO 10_0856]
MTSPVSDPQQPADTVVQPEVQPAGPEFEVYTPPAFAPPQQFAAPMPAPVPPKPKRTGVVVLAIFTVLLFGAAGAFGALFFMEKAHSADLSKQIETKDREAADLTKKAKDSKDDALRASDAQKQAEAAQKKAEADAATSQQCRDAARELRTAAIANDQAKGTEAAKNVFTHC